MPNVTKVTSALVTKLGADAALIALMPDGAWFKVAPQGATRFVLVSLIDAVNEPQLGGKRAAKDCLYLIDARALATGDPTAATAVDAAAARLDDLLDPQPPLPPATLDVEGYSLVDCQCEEDVQDTETDDVDPSILWYRAGGHFRIQVAPL
jgi:hypothetical protein